MLVFQIKRLASWSVVDQTVLVDITKQCNIGELIMLRELDVDIIIKLRNNTNVIKLPSKVWKRRFRI